MPEVDSPQPHPASGLGTLLGELDGLDRLGLITRLRADQLRHWQAGERIPAEDYIGQVPALRDDPELAIDLIFSEFLLRRDFLREAPDLDEYLKRFPQHAPVLRRQLELDALAQEATPTHVRPDAAPLTGAAPKGASVWTVVGRQASASVPGGAPSLPGYDVLGELGRGGMGLVLRGRDLHLGRDLAVKLLHEEYRGQPHLVRRFVNEARICGRLQHPGIVPIHALGALADGRPYFTMKLVEGRTLADLLDDRADPAQDQTRFLGIFEQVCQAVAYAHSKGVIHRDLKPENVMVGTFGEVQVMDWGLAKVLRKDEGGRMKDEQDTSASSFILHPSSFAATQLGHALGTLPYMPPECARGEVDRMDERCDVFSLGAILCEILTDQPPIRGKGATELLARARACDHGAALAALDGCGADAELVRLAKSCLAAEPSARPRDAGEVAARVGAHAAAVQGRLRQAELERGAAQARAEEAKTTAAAERKARRRTRALATALLALVAVGAGGGLWVQHLAAGRQADQARRDAEQRQQVEFALDKASGLRQQAHWREALAVLDQARHVLGDAGPADLRQRLDVAEGELRLVNRLDGIRQRLATVVEGNFDTRTAAAAYAAAFREAGLGEVGDDETAVAARVRASEVSKQLVAALDNWAFVAEEAPSKSWLLAVARRADPHPWGDRFRDPNVWRDGKALQALANDALRDDGAQLDDLSPQVLASLGWLLRRRPEAVSLLRAAQRRYPSDFWLSLELANALRKAKKEVEALGHDLVAVALRPDASVAHNNLGLDLRATKDLDGAIAEFKKAIELDPESALAQINLGNALYDKKDLDGAIAEYRMAIDLDARYAPAHNNLGVALRANKDLDGAVAECRKAIDLDSRYVEAHCNLGAVLYDKKDLDGATAAYRKAIDIDPTNAFAHNNLGVALRDKKDLDGAIAACRKALDLDPRYALAHRNLGAALYDKKDLDGAIAACRKALDLDPMLALAHSSLGDALYGKKDLDGAIAAFRTALDLDPTLATAHNGRGVTLRDKGNLDGAIAAYRTALDLDPTLANAHNNLGVALRDKKDLDGAIAAFRKAIEFDPENANAHYNLGNALRARGDLDGAIAEFKKAIEWDPRNANAHNNLGNALRARGDLDGAIAAYRTALDFDPKHALAHNNLGAALRANKDVDGAIAEFKKAIGCDPKYAPAHNNLGLALLAQGRFHEARTATLHCLELLPEHDPLRRFASGQLQQCERLAALDEKLPAVLRGEAEPADAAERLALGQLCGQHKQRHAAAARFYSDAFAADTQFAADLQQQHRYNAACSAALASAGHAEDAKNLPDKARHMLRRQALGWLRADLALYAKQAAGNDPMMKAAVRQRLGHWRQDADLASVRDPEGLTRLPAVERQDWQKLWQDVTALLDRAGAAP
jgi:tetratricopeptide (TPR) repeat protein